jgi:hypothetical protein
MADLELVLVDAGEEVHAGCPADSLAAGWERPPLRKHDPVFAAW